MPAAFPGNSTTKLARAAAGGGFESAIEAITTFTPLFAEDFSAGTLGTEDPAWTRSEYQNQFAKSGTQSLAIRTAPADPDGVCGGSVWYAGRQLLPAEVPLGNAVWQRFYMYIPSTFSFAYSYNKWNQLLADGSYTAGADTFSFTDDQVIRSESVGERVAIMLDTGQWHFSFVATGTDPANNILVIEDSIPSAVSSGNAIKTGSVADAEFCGTGNIDGSGSGGLKFLVFAANNVGGLRIYLNQDTPYRRIDNDAGIFRINMEAGVPTSVDVIGGGQIPLPRDQWFSLQMAVKADAGANEGWARAWIDDQLIVNVENTKTVSSSATAITQWGIGDYWNGLPWTDGQPGRDTFYIDEVIVASDIPGYGAPTTTDSSGNPYISPSTLAGDL